MIAGSRFFDLGKSEIENPQSKIKISRCSSGVEHFLGKEEAMGSNPIIGSAFINKRQLKNKINLQKFL